MKLILLVFSCLFLGPALAANGKFSLFIKETVARSSSHPRSVYVYLPPGYDPSGAERYPVLYMHDGQNLFDPARSNFGETWEVTTTLNDLIGRKLIPPMIVVAVDFTPDRVYEYTHAWEPTRKKGGGAQVYLDYLFYDLKRYVDHVFPTDPRPSRTGLLGSSLGGLVTAFGGARFPEGFGLIGAMSPSVWWDGKSILKIVRSTQPPVRAYVDSGTVDGETPEDARELAEAYKEAGVESLKLVIEPGAGHKERFWARRLPGALEFLFSTE